MHVANYLMIKTLNNHLAYSVPRYSVPRYSVPRYSSKTNLRGANINTMSALEKNNITKKACELV